MKKKKYSDAQIMGILKQAESGVPVSELGHVNIPCRSKGKTDRQSADVGLWPVLFVSAQREGFWLECHPAGYCAAMHERDINVFTGFTVDWS